MKDRIERLERFFPNLYTVGYSPMSDEDAGYNCAAWAAGENFRFWGGKPNYWPGVFGRSVENAVQAFETLGYHICAGGDLEPGYEKIVIYVDKLARWEHVARQLPDGRWTSKIGDLEDIIHRTPFALVGREFGEVMYFMRRPVAGA